MSAFRPANPGHYCKLRANPCPSFPWWKLDSKLTVERIGYRGSQEQATRDSRPGIMKLGKKRSIKSTWVAEGAGIRALDRRDGPGGVVVYVGGVAFFFESGMFPYPEFNIR